MEQRKRKISVEGPPDEVDDEVIGPLPVGSGGGTKKRRGMRLIWREFWIFLTLMNAHLIDTLLCVCSSSLREGVLGRPSQCRDVWKELHAQRHHYPCGLHKVSSWLVQCIYMYNIMCLGGALVVCVCVRTSFCAFPCTPYRTDFIATASQDGHLKFWKKLEEGIEFVKHFRAHLGE